MLNNTFFPAGPKGQGWCRVQVDGWRRWWKEQWEHSAAESLDHVEAGAGDDGVYVMLQGPGFGVNDDD